MSPLGEEATLAVLRVLCHSVSPNAHCDEFMDEFVDLVARIDEVVGADFAKWERQLVEVVGRRLECEEAGEEEENIVDSEELTKVMWTEDVMELEAQILEKTGELEVVTEQVRDAKSDRLRTNGSQRLRSTTQPPLFAHVWCLWRPF